MARLKKYKPYRFYAFVQLRFLGLLVFVNNHPVNFTDLDISLFIHDS